MDIKIIGADEVISRKGGGKRHGAKYADYAAALKPHVEWLDDQIENSEDGAIRVKLADFAKACGKVMKKVVNGEVVPNAPGLDPTSLGWGFKYVLFHAGFGLTMGKIDDGQPVMVIRKKVDGEMLPASLAKYDAQNKIGVTAENGDGGETGEEETGEDQN